jgi:hypothetical protein
MHGFPYVNVGGYEFDNAATLRRQLFCFVFFRIFCGHGLESNGIKKRKTFLVIPAQAGIHNTVPYGALHGFPPARE